MNKSENINELAVALSKFTGEVKDAPKTKEVKSAGKGPSYKHAELSGILEIARPLLSKYGLSVLQLPGNADDKITVETVLLHNSGQWISETIVMPLDPPELMSGKDSYGNAFVNRRKGLSHPQEVGKYITYARRYGLAAILGIAQTDDEAEMIKTPQYDSAPEPSYVSSAAAQNQKQYIGAVQVADLKTLINGDVPTSNYIRQKYGIQRLDDLTLTQYVEIKDELRIMNAKIENKSTLNDDDAMKLLNNAA